MYKNVNEWYKKVATHMTTSFWIVGIKSTGNEHNNPLNQRFSLTIRLNGITLWTCVDRWRNERCHTNSKRNDEIKIEDDIKLNHK